MQRSPKFAPFARVATVVAILASAACIGQAPPLPPPGGPSVPDLLYYTFDEGPGATATANLAVPGVGSLNAVLTGHTMNNLGLSGTGFTGSGTTSANLNTGWAPNLSGDWTVAFWLDVTSATTGSFPFAAVDQYIFGEFSTMQWYCGTVGTTVRMASGPFNPVFPSVDIPGGADTSQPHGIAFVYDSSVPEFRGYLDGVLVTTTSLPAPLTFTGAGTNAFALGAFQVSPTFGAGAVMDEFRLYSRVLSAGEIATTWNMSLGSFPTTAPYQVNQAGAQLVVAGTQTFGYAPANVVLQVGQPAQVQLYSTNLAQAWDLGFASNPLLTVATGALTASDGQIVHLDISDPTFSTWFNFMTSAPPFANIDLSFTPPVPQVVSVQAVVFDPTKPSGLSLSQGMRIVVQ